MKNTSGLICCLLTLLLFAAPAWGATNYWTGTNGGNWSDQNYWSLGRPPLPSETAVIMSDCECTISNYDAVALKIIIEPCVNDCGEEDRYALRVEADATLTITDDSEIDDRLEVLGDLIIGDDLTIQGEGGEIALSEDSGAGRAGVIRSEAQEDNTLTIGGDCPGEQEESCTLVIRGHGEIQVRLVNEGMVVADACQDKMPYTGGLWLNEYPKTGGGIWEATCGTLTVATTVSGSGDWRIHDPPEHGTGDGTIHFQSSCTGLTGDVTLEIGTLDVDQDLCTTGRLTFRSVPTGEGRYTVPVADVAPGKTAKFATTCP